MAADASSPLLADVLLPLHVRSTYTYRVPPAQADGLRSGMRVLVPLGAKKIYSGVVRRLYAKDADTAAPAEHSLRPIQEVLDELPVVPERLLELFDWAASYYLCSPGMMLKAALPKGLKLASELVVRTVFSLEELDELSCPGEDYRLLEGLALHGELSLADAAQVLERKDPRPRLKALAAQGWLRLEPVVAEGYRPKTVRALAPAEAYAGEAGLKQAFEQVQQAPKQEQALLVVAESALRGEYVPEKEVRERTGVTANVIQALVKKGVVVQHQLPVDRLAGRTTAGREAITLTAAQEAALASIRQHQDAEPGRPLLLRGVTGAGKTHLYIERIRETLAAGRQALYLLPEIGLTKQIIERVQAAFGERVGVYHSRFSAAERVEIWQKVLRGEYAVVIGVRSALLLPFEELGLIVVDEEHDASFKQSQSQPHYNARDLALWYGRRFGVPVLLGSATPAVETYANAKNGKFALVELDERPRALAPVAKRVVDMRPQVAHRLSHGLFSDELLQGLAERLGRGEQAILFRNRRGYAPFLRCTTCGHIPQCVRCDISLTYHERAHQSRCHYCGYTDTQVERCGHCGALSLQRVGIGTERLVEHLAERFPRARIERMDQDTTRGKHGFERLIGRVERGEIDLLVGTQMVTKGLDFPNVTLVGVLDADQSLNWPDFRAQESSYQLFAQFMGRAGRHEKAGEVMLQTYQPEHPIFELLERPYESFFEVEYAARQEPNYPPFCRLIRLELQHAEPAFLQQEAAKLGQELRSVFGQALLGPEFPQIRRLRGRYRMQFLLKLTRGADTFAAKERLQALIQAYYEAASSKSLRLDIDVDPR